MRVIVTGGSGFIGTNLVGQLGKCGHEVLNLDISPPRNVAQGKFWQKVDILDRSALNSVIAEFSPDLIYHLAARTDLLGRSLKDYPENVTGVQNLAEIAANCLSLKRVVFASSMLVCKLGYMPKSETDYCPTTAYGESKAEGERIVRRAAGSRFEWVIVRPTSLWGPWFATPYRDFFDAVRSGWYLLPKGISVKRSYGFVLNSVRQLVALSIAPEKNTNQKVFYIADYEPLELGAWAAAIQREFAAPRLKQAPMAILRLAAMGGDALKALGVKNPRLTTFRLNNMVTSAIFDLAALRSVCGPLPYDEQTAVKMTVDWMRTH